MSLSHTTIYIVRGFVGGKRCVYEKAATPEGANLLAEEAARVGWTSVAIEVRRISTY